MKFLRPQLVIVAVYHTLKESGVKVNQTEKLKILSNVGENL